MVQTKNDIDFTTDTLEKLLVKTVFSDKNWLNTLSKSFDIRWFKSEYSGIILNLTLSYYKKYDECPSFQVVKELLKKYSEKHPEKNIKLSEANDFLFDIQNFNLNASKNVLETNLQQFILKNAFYHSLFDNAELLDRNPDNYEKVVDLCLNNFEKVRKIVFSNTELGLNYFNAEAMKNHWEFLKNPEAKIKTGFESLDNYTNGGVLKDGKMLFLIMAQAGLGKSAFLSNMAVNFLKQNLSVVVITLEMSENVYAQRFDAHISNKNINTLMEDPDDTIDKIKKFYTKYPNANLIIKEYPPKSINSNDISIYLENLRNNGIKFDVVIVDYLGLVLPNRKTDSMYKDGLAVSEELRKLSYDFGVPVISAVQSNTDGMNNENIDMQNVSESRGIVHTTDFMGAMIQRIDDRAEGIISMRILKNRLGGQVGKICTFKLDPETLVFSDLTFDNNFIPENDDDVGNVIRNLSSMANDIMEID